MEIKRFLGGIIVIITIFHSLVDDRLLKIEELDSIEKDLDSAMRACLMKGYKVNNYQDRVAWS